MKNEKNVLKTNHGRERTVKNLMHSKSSVVDPDSLCLWASRIRILPSTSKKRKKKTLILRFCDFFLTSYL